VSALFQIGDQPHIVGRPAEDVALEAAMSIPAKLARKLPECAAASPRGLAPVTSSVARMYSGRAASESPRPAYVQNTVAGG